MRVTILGCGSSAGVPFIGGETPANPKNSRLRASIHIAGKETSILVDTSPDLRQQMLVNKISKVDSILYTHAHADHVHGIDDIKSLNHLRQGVINAYGDEKTIDEITNRFAYCFREPRPEYGWFRPSLVANKIKIGESFQLGEFTITAFMQNHGNVHSLGYRINNFVYSTDVKSFPEESKQWLHDADVWVVDALRPDAAPTHSHLAQTLEWIDEFKPKRAVLTHMGGQMDYDQLKATLPDTVEPAFDGLVIEL